MHKRAALLLTALTAVVSCDKVEESAFEVALQGLPALDGQTLAAQAPWTGEGIEAALNVYFAERAPERGGEAPTSEILLVMGGLTTVSNAPSEPEGQPVALFIRTRPLWFYLDNVADTEYRRPRPGWFWVVSPGTWSALCFLNGQAEPHAQWHGECEFDAGPTFSFAFE